MNNKKGIISIIISIVVVITNISIVFATQETSATSEKTKEEQYYKQIGTILGHFGYSEESDIYCSQLVEVYNSETQRNDELAMLVFDKDEVIGIMTSFEIEGEIAYNFIYSDFENVSESIDQNEEILLINAEDQMLCITENKEIAITGEAKEIDENIREEGRKFEKYAKKIEKKKLPENISFETIEDYIEQEKNCNEVAEQNYEISVASESSYNTYLPSLSQIDISKSYANSSNYNSYLFKYVPFVQNDSTNNGLCWTACGAMVSRYYGKGAYTAKELYEKVIEVYGKETAGNKAGIEKMYTMLSLKYLYYARKLSYGEIFQALNNGKLVHMAVQKCDGYNVYAAHGIILCGTFYAPSDDKYYYIYRDPNVNGYVVNSVIESTLNTSYGNVFYYRVGNNMYNNWITTFVVYK